MLGILVISLANTIVGTNRHIEKPFAQNPLFALASLDQPSQLGTSDPPIIHWNKTYGGTSDDRGESIQQTSDGGYVIAGETWSFGAGGPDFYLAKTDADCNIQWNKTYGGPLYDQAYSVIQTSDGGYALSGRTGSYGAGFYDFWLVKTDASGNMQWNKTYGGSNEEEASSVLEAFDGGYVLAGYTNSYGAGGYDFWLVKTDGLGNAQWNKTYGGIGLDLAYSASQTADGGYIVAGYTSSVAGMGLEIWLVKTDSDGNQQWAQNYGGVSDDVAYSVRQTSDGGYVAAGWTNSFGAGGRDYLIVKTDGSGDHQWNKTYGGAMRDEVYSLIQSGDGGYLLAGPTWSFGAGSADFWLIKTDEVGDAEWNITLGGANEDFATSVRQASDAGYIIAGYTSSFGAGSYDVWLVKLAPTGITLPITVADYDGLWHRVDFDILLTASSAIGEVAETFYRINDGPTKTVSVNGQPRITVESASNKLEYWSVDIFGYQEIPKILNEIKLDKTAPSGSIAIDQDASYTNSTAVTLALSAFDATSGIRQVRYSNYDSWNSEPWEESVDTKPWTLLSGDGTKTVYYQIEDNAGWLSNHCDTIVLDTTPPSISADTPTDAASISTSTLSFNVSAKDLESGITKVELCLDGDLGQNMDAVSEDRYSLTVLELIDGSHTWYAKAYNGAGTVTTMSTRSFTVQTGQGLQSYYSVLTILGLLALLVLAYYFIKRKRKQSNVENA